MTENKPTFKDPKLPDFTSPDMIELLKCSALGLFLPIDIKSIRPHRKDNEAPVGDWYGRTIVDTEERQEILSDFLQTSVDVTTLHTEWDNTEGKDYQTALRLCHGIGAFSVTIDTTYRYAKENGDAELLALADGAREFCNKTLTHLYHVS